MESFKILGTDELASVASPFRQQLLGALSSPNSASRIARDFDLSRQRVGYHMRELERTGCIECVSEQRARGLTEKLYQAKPMAFAASPKSEAQRLDTQDRFSWSALVSLVAQSLWELITLRRRADAGGKRLATLALDAELEFPSPADRKAFAEDLIDAVEAVIRKHEHAKTDSSRTFRLVLGAYPKLNEGSTKNDKTNAKH